MLKFVIQGKGSLFVNPRKEEALISYIHKPISLIDDNLINSIHF